eukprot:Filipodium_phascolosomae@DN1511_c0_g1_i2.p1
MFLSRFNNLCRCWGFSANDSVKDGNEHYEIDGLLSGTSDEEQQAAPLSNDDIVAYVHSKRRHNAPDGVTSLRQATNAAKPNVDFNMAGSTSFEFLAYEEDNFHNDKNPLAGARGSHDTSSQAIFEQTGYSSYTALVADPSDANFYGTSTSYPDDDQAKIHSPSDPSTAVVANCGSITRSTTSSSYASQPGQSYDDQTTKEEEAFDNQHSNEGSHNINKIDGDSKVPSGLMLNQDFEGGQFHGLKSFSNEGAEDPFLFGIHQHASSKFQASKDLAASASPHSSEGPVLDPETVQIDDSWGSWSGTGGATGTPSNLKSTSPSWDFTADTAFQPTNSVYEEFEDDGGFF